MHLSRDRFVPAGSLGISQDEAGLADELWDSPDLQSWHRFCQFSPDVLIESDSNRQHLPLAVQECLFKAGRLRALLMPLFRAHWIDLELRVNSHPVKVATIRIYLLPDDAYRKEVDRSYPSLTRSRKKLLRALDYSRDAWQGISLPSSTGPSSLASLTQHDVSQDESLLQVFNRIPSPSPDPNLVNEYHLQTAMYDVLDSVVFGLTTQLHPYQRRSTALMLQRESNPGKVLDPRLVTAENQAGLPWYFDSVSGAVLAEPRFYDGISGGILAEEMGSGKTIICLALILATRDFPTKPPEIYSGGSLPVRAKIASLADMTASCASRHAVPWKSHLGYWKKQSGYELTRCAEAVKRNPPYYQRPAIPLRRGVRRSVHSYYSYQHPPSTTIYLSPASVVIVPNNLVAQWQQEIEKHTRGLEVVVLTRNDPLPEVENLLEYDLILFSQSRFEAVAKEYGGFRQSSLASVHFKRCIVDEGHKLGNSRISHRSNLLTGLDAMNLSSRWIVTGTPSHGLFGVVDTRTLGKEHGGASEEDAEEQEGWVSNQSSTEMEKKDLQRLGAIASLYLKARPWASAPAEAEDAGADWNTYLLLPKHNPRSYGRWDSLKSTLNSLIIRHRLAEVSDLLPPVDERIIVLDGSYQDRLSLNVFAMMIIFNSVQSERKDVDYFFHVRQRKSLLQIVYNLKQTSFFGGSFFSSEEIAKAVETAEEFLREQKVPIKKEDEALLREAVDFGRLAIQNKLRELSNQFHEVPVCVEEFPANAGQSWSLDGKVGDTVCTSPILLLSLQKLLRDAVGAPEQLNSLLNGRLILAGTQEKDRILAAASGGNGKNSDTLAGNTKLGNDSPRKARSNGVAAVKAKETTRPDDLPAPLQLTRITSTVSAKLSYLIDSIVRHQEQEKMIVFYENENVAWYLASMLDVLQIQHLIYAKGLTSERRARYVDTFHSNPTFRVLLMDLSQAAFGLDMREASRIYFINPVLNPQVEAQAIGRVRRISQQKPVSVETLVLKNSIDEVILERKKHMSQAEHRQAKSILDIQPIYEWIQNARIVRLPDTDGDGFSEMAQLKWSALGDSVAIWSLNKKRQHEKTT
ncbi:hypothetical protein G6O67_001587 [Ophiocordyceps sinensis]|uniref:Helicase C-terminal domain-containing protein n=1 Tax=Ophiocordyceps sinensis TaxID=72228 RepID=A0A8H4V927_9HYPO|nr:hypothetical protein G6O67_001587 [Ophiocordyceps sinensis]